MSAPDVSDLRGGDALFSVPLWHSDSTRRDPTGPRHRLLGDPWRDGDPEGPQGSLRVLTVSASLSTMTLLDSQSADRVSDRRQARVIQMSESITSTAPVSPNGPVNVTRPAAPRLTAADVQAMIAESNAALLASMAALLQPSAPAPSHPLPPVNLPTNTPVPPGTPVRHLAPSGPMDPVIGQLPAANDRRTWDALCRSHGSAAIDAIDGRISALLAQVEGDCIVGNGKDDTSFFRITAYAAVKYYEASTASDFGGAHQLPYWESLSRGASADSKLGKLRAYLDRWQPVIKAIRPWADLRGELLGKDGFPELRRKGRWAKTASREVDFS